MIMKIKTVVMIPLVERSIPGGGDYTFILGSNFIARLLRAAMSLNTHLRQCGLFEANLTVHMDQVQSYNYS